MTNGPLDTDVLIVGAGPVGLLLACECARRGLRFRIVERRPHQSEHSKALAIFPRTLEILDMAGLAGPFLAVANRVDAIRVANARRTLAQIPFVPRGTVYPFIAMVPQDVTERLLVDALRGMGGEVDYQTAFVSAVQGTDAVSVTLDRQGQGETATARFVVGCDGARSAVRSALGLAFEGGEYEERFMLADIESNVTFAANEMQLCPDSEGPLAIFPMSATRRRIVAMVKDAEGDAPTLAQTRRLLAERAPAGIEARALHWSSYFHIHHRRVAELRRGRMFVAGDAAHIHSPFGGQGMNTGLQDVWNLAWKLDLAVRGYGSDLLLDSYTAERIPVIKDVIETTHFLTRALGTPSRIAEALRNAIIPVLSRLPPFRHAMVQRLSELGIAYAGSPIVEGPGERCVDDSMRAGGVLRRFLLFVDTHASEAVVEAATRLVAAHAGVLELRRTGRPGVALVRPDGYLALADIRGGAGVLESVRELIERQTGHA
ncbi:MAG TPA: FAD-dependent monooxygenase [Rhodanobacteraceae bacterium]|nr:FAD-dependent monooxygenase [Rhodanobacteraceae bacterium]